MNHVDPSTTAIVRSTPLAAHSELQVISGHIGGKGVLNEYRVYDFRTLPSGRKVHGGQSGIILFSIAVLAAWILGRVHRGALHSVLLQLSQAEVPKVALEDKYLLLLPFLLIAALLITRVKTYQSALPLPFLGVQLETTMYLAVPFSPSEIPLSCSKTFVPLSNISTVIINEAPTRWHIHYYLAIVLRDGRGVVVAFDKVRPRHAVLREVYHALREQLFDEYAND